MTLAALSMLVVALVVVPGGLIASTVFLVVKPELAEYPPLPPGLPD
ncbi:MAG: MetS family NSS transporter small subunit [Bifidobacteriaceae bacterium]|jgi:hypothetical protein|nr:MetS family NSS transporter small subunit [Bifidobacteriaceae bacterium]